MVVPVSYPTISDSQEYDQGSVSITSTREAQRGLILAYTGISDVYYEKFSYYITAPHIHDITI